MDQRFFGEISVVLSSNRKLNGSTKELQDQFNAWGRSPDEFRKTVPDVDRKIIRRAVQFTLNLDVFPSDCGAFGHVRNLYGAISRTDRDAIGRERLTKFTQYIANA